MCDYHGCKNTDTMRIICGMNGGPTRKHSLCNAHGHEMFQKYKPPLAAGIAHWTNLPMASAAPQPQSGLSRLWRRWKSSYFRSFLRGLLGMPHTRRCGHEPEAKLFCKSCRSRGLRGFVGVSP